MGLSIFGIGVSGLNAAQAGLATAGHNISNAATPGYSRQEIVQATNVPQLTGYGFVGQGVDVNTVRRLYNEALTQQLAGAQSQGGQYSAYAVQINEMANLLADPSAGLSPRLQDFFAALADVAAHPESYPSRQTLLSSANALVASFQGIDQQFQDVRDGVNSALTSGVDLINSYARQIATLNRSIQVAESAVVSQQANDLRDQRDALVEALNKEVRATVVRQGDGTFNVFVGNGQPLVVGTSSFQLVATPSTYDPQRLEIGYQSGGTLYPLSSSSLQGGHLGGLLAFRDQSLDPAQNALGRVAMGLAQSFNDQHLLGQDLNGNLGASFFTVPEPRVLSSRDNAGTAVLSATLQSADALTLSEYKLSYAGAAAGNENFVLTRLTDGMTTPIAFPSATGYPASFSADGVLFTVTAGATALDSWLVEPTRHGAANVGLALSDPAGIAAASPIRSASALGNLGDARISAGSVSSVANLPLGASITLTYNAGLGSFSVAGALPPIAAFAYTAGASIDLNGIGFSISGTPADGDQFTLSSNPGGVSDNRNALALGALQTLRTLGRDASVPGGQASATLQEAYAQLVSEVGNRARQMDVSNKAQTNIIAQTRQAQQSVSGVNLDEEAANLLRYQQIYQASGKMMQIAGSLFDTVLQLGR